MTQRIAIYPDRCVGCRLCSMGCAINKTGEVGLAKSLIWVTHFGEESRYIPTTCTHCQDAWCVRACPTGAIVIDPVTERKTVIAAKCVGCRMCNLACPFGAMTYDNATGKATKCDECLGDPECVKFCPVAALQWEDENAAQIVRRREVARKLKEALE